MVSFCYKLLILSCLCLCSLQQNFVAQDYELPELLEQVEQLEGAAELDLTHVNWRAVIPLLLQRQQLQLCVAVYRYNPQLVAGTFCDRLLGNGLMAYCDIGHVEDLSMTMRDAFGGMLFDTMQRCRPGLELFGVRCRRRA